MSAAPLHLHGHGVRRGWPLALAGLLVMPSMGCTRDGDSIAAVGASAAAAPRLQVVAPAGAVGFDARVELRAHVEGAADRRYAIRVRQVFGPPARELETRDDGVRFRTPLAPRRADPSTPATATPRGVLALSAADAGRMVFRVEAVGPTTLRRTVEVFPAFPSAGWPRMATGVSYRLPAADGGQWRVERGSVRLGGAAGPGVISARASAGGWHRLRTPGGEALELRAGGWLGNESCGRVDCHPREQRGWHATAHATVFARGISGELDGPTRGRYQRRCIACHTIGYQPGANNGGFAARARELGWEFPSELRPSTWRALPAALKARANVGCESCHGPGWFYVGYGDDVCAQCHDHPPEYTKVREHRSTRMSRTQRRLAGSALARREGAVCAQCHEAAGYLQSLRGHRSTSKAGRDLDLTPRGVTCAACHDPHSSRCDKQLRLCGAVEVPGRTFDAGKGALCISCHNGESDVVRGPLLRPFVPGRPERRLASGHGDRVVAPAAAPRSAAAPHAPQLQLLASRGGLFLQLPGRAEVRPPNPHLLVPDSCVGCHSVPWRSSNGGAASSGGHTFRLAPARARDKPLCTGDVDLARLRGPTRTDSCARCHGEQPSLDLKARGDHDGDHRIEGFIEEVEGLLHALSKAITARLAGESAAVHLAIVDEQIVLADRACRPLGGADGRPRVLAPVGERRAIYQAAFNALMVLRDGSGGLHNPRYVVRLLKQSIAGLARR